MSTETLLERLDDIVWSERFWVWARIVFIALCLMVGSAIGLGACGCTPALPASTREASAQELQSVVTLVTPYAQVSELGERIEHGWAPYCNAFAVKPGVPDPPTLPVLVTAAHCVAKVKLAVGDTVRYREPSGWGLGSARVTHLDASRDYAVLELERAEGLAALELGRAPYEGAYVTSPSAFFGEAVSGQVYASGGRSFAFSGTIERGWSGSPVLDTQGRAVGVVIKCVLDDERACTDGVIAGAL